MVGGQGVLVGEDGIARCWWCAEDPLYRSYHDQEWGRPVGDDRHLFEKLSLEGFQSGLSWLTILRKRGSFRRAFADFDVDLVAAFDDGDIQRLMEDRGIVRNRAKIAATINNARRCRELVDEVGSLARFIWRFEPKQRSEGIAYDDLLEMTVTAESKALSKELRRRGWAFVGPTTAYAFMQSTGLVNDHLVGCEARDRVARERGAFTRP
jgi:DNA-3-methyladenine glycosylase I